MGFSNWIAGKGESLVPIRIAARRGASRVSFEDSSLPPTLLLSVVASASYTSMSQPTSNPSTTNALRGMSRVSWGIRGVWRYLGSSWIPAAL